MEDILYKHKNQSGKFFKIITIPDKMPSDILKRKKLSIGFDPNLFTEKTLSIFLEKMNVNLNQLLKNLIDEIWKRKKKKKNKNFIYFQINL